MKFDDFSRKCYAHLDTWVNHFGANDMLFRLWTKGDMEEEVCEFVYITHIIKLPNGEVMIGVQTYDESYEDNCYPYITYYMLSEVRLAVSKLDQHDE